MKPGTTRKRVWRIVLWVIGLELIIGFAFALVRPSSELSELERDLREGRYAKAEKVIAAWKSSAPRSAEPYYWDARLNLANRRPEAFNVAVKEADARGLDPRRSELLKVLSTAASGRFLEVEPWLRDHFNANSLGDPDPLVMAALASGYLGTYDMPRAASVIKRWMAACPNDPTPYLRRAEIDMRKADNQALIVDYREALKRDPGLAKARLGLAEALRELHQVEEAASVIAEYLTGNDDAAGRLCAGRIALERSLTADALAQLKQAIAFAPENSVAHKVLGDALLRQGDFVEAFDELERAKTIDPFDLEVRHNLVIALTRLGRKDDAKKEQETAARFRAELQTMLSAQAQLMKTPADLASRVVICRWMFEHGKADQGILWAEAILKEHPGEPDASRLLADHYAAIGKTGLANYHRLQAERGGKASPRETEKSGQSVEPSQPLR